MNDLIAKVEKALETKTDIMAVLKRFTQEMEGYIYYGSNPGVPEDDYDEVATEIADRRRPIELALVELLKLADELIGIDEVNDPRGQWDEAIQKIRRAVEENYE